jgi:hypothetical protein
MFKGIGDDVTERPPEKSHVSIYLSLAEREEIDSLLASLQLVIRKNLSELLTGLEPLTMEQKICILGSGQEEQTVDQCT